MNFGKSPSCFSHCSTRVFGVVVSGADHRRLTFARGLRVPSSSFGVRSGVALWSKARSVLGTASVYVFPQSVWLKSSTSVSLIVASSMSVAKIEEIAQASGAMSDKQRKYMMALCEVGKAMIDAKFRTAVKLAVGRPMLNCKSSD